MFSLRFFVFLGGGICRPILTSNLKAKLQKLHTYLLFDISQVNKNPHFPNNWKAGICTTIRAIGNFNGFLKRLFLILEPLNC